MKSRLTGTREPFLNTRQNKSVVTCRAVTQHTHRFPHITVSVSIYAFTLDHIYIYSILESVAATVKGIFSHSGKTEK